MFCEAYLQYHKNYIVWKVFMQIVYVQWEDAYLKEGWHNNAEVEDILNDPVWLVESVGWLIDQDENRIIICGSANDKLGSCSEILKIPARAIIDLIILSGPADGDGSNGAGGVFDFDPIDPTLPSIHSKNTIFMGPADEN